MVPLMVPPAAGQACVPAGPLPRLVHRNTTMGPLFVRFSKWMWACVASVSKSLKVSRYWISSLECDIEALNSPTPGVDSAGTSS
jgi:hypothetical protein